MSTNGHKNGVNPHDAIAARIVAGAIQADKLPAAAAKAVRRALNAAGAQPPAEGESNLAAPQGTVTIGPGMNQPAPQPDPEVLQALGRRVQGYTDAVMVAMVREREAAELEPGAVTSEQTEDGVVRVFLHGALMGSFLPPEVAQEADGALTVNLCFQVVPQA